MFKRILLIIIGFSVIFGMCQKDWGVTVQEIYKPFWKADYENNLKIDLEASADHIGINESVNIKAGVFKVVMNGPDTVFISKNISSDVFIKWEIKKFENYTADLLRKGFSINRQARPAGIGLNDVKLYTPEYLNTGSFKDYVTRKLDEIQIVCSVKENQYEPTFINRMISFKWTN